MTDAAIPFPHRGLNDNRAYGEQPQDTAESLKNVRVADPVTGRSRGGQREGLVKHFPTTVSAGSAVLRLNHLTYDKKKFTYEALRGDSDTAPAVGDVEEEWTLETDTDKDAVNMATDLNGNRYVLAGHTLEKLNTDGTSLWTIALDVSDVDDTLGPLVVDTDGSIYAAVASGITQEGASIFRVAQQAIPNSSATEPVVKWEWVLDRWVRELRLYNGQLKVLMQDDAERRAYVLTMSNLSLSVPTEGKLIGVSYPATCLVVKSDGSVVTGHPPYADRDTSPKHPGTKLPLEKWTIESLDSWKERVWSWYRAEDLVADGIGDGEPVPFWSDRSGNGRNLLTGVPFGSITIADSPSLRMNGSFPFPSVRFDGSQGLFSLPGGGKDSQRSACLSALPNHGDGAFCTFVVCRPASQKTPGETDDTGTEIDARRFLFMQQHHTTFGGAYKDQMDAYGPGTRAFGSGVLLNSGTNVSYTDDGLFVWGISNSKRGTTAPGYARAITSSSGYFTGTHDPDGYAPSAWIPGSNHDWPGMPLLRGSGDYGWPAAVLYDDPAATEAGEGLVVLTFMHCGGLDEALEVSGTAVTTSFTVTDTTLLKNYPTGATSGTWTLYESDGTSIGAISNIDTATGVLTIPSSSYTGTAYIVPPRNLMSRSLFRSSGMPADRWEALPMGFNGSDAGPGATTADQSIELNVSANPTGFGFPEVHKYLKPFLGEVAEWITLGRRQTNDDRVLLGGAYHHVYPTVLDHPMYSPSQHVNDVPTDQSYADPGSNLNSSEIEKIEGWLMHRYGIAHHLEDTTSSYVHPHYPAVGSGAYDVPLITDPSQSLAAIAGVIDVTGFYFDATDTDAFIEFVGNQGELVLDGVDEGTVAVTTEGRLTGSGGWTPGAATVTSLSIVGGKAWIGRLRNPSAQLLKTSAGGELVWCLVSDKQASGLTVGDIVTKDINDLSVVLSPGPEATSGLALDSNEDIYWVGPGVGADGAYCVGKVTDSEDTSMVISKGFYDSVGGAQPNSEVLFPADVTVRPQVDEWDNLLVPIVPGCTHSSVDPVEAIRIFQPDGTYVSNISTLLHGSATYQNCWALALPLENPTYDDLDFLLSPSIRRPEFCYLALERDDNSGGSGPEVAKWRLVSATQTGDSGARLTDFVAVAGTHIWYDLADVWTKATSNATALGSLATYVASTVHNSKLYYTDGGNYRVYDPKTKLVAKWTSEGAGVLPENCLLITTYRDRVVLARGGQKWYMSAVNDPTNWDYSPPVITTDQAVAGTLSPAGQSKDIINAMIGGGDDYLIFGCDSSIWRLSGDPMKGGELDEVSKTIGVAFGDSMVRDEAGMVYFYATTGGVYVMEPLGAPKCLSDSTDGQDVSIQRRVSLINLSTHRPVLIWDHLRRGLRVIQVPYDTTSTEILKAWYWDKKNNAWLEDEPGSSAIQPFSATVFDGDDPADRAVVFGCSDGYVRRADNDAVSDDGVAIDSLVCLGPYMAGNDQDIALDRMRAVLAKDQGGCEWQIHVANTPDGLEDAELVADGRFEPGLSPRVPVFKRGAFMWITLRNVSVSERWALESLLGDFEPMGTRTSY